MIVVDDLVKQFGRTVAVDHVSFTIGQGEVVGFLGPNGAGKTTTIRVLCSFHPPTSGRAAVGGHDVVADSVAARRLIGYLPENVPLYPDLRVTEYLVYRAALKGVPRAQRRQTVEHAIERCELGDVRRKLVGHVSRGYRQRVGLADALVGEPPILILDEPTSGLDPTQRRRMKTLVGELSQKHTILFSSHVLSEVQDVATRILLIDRGRIRADGAPATLLQGSAGRRLTVAAALADEVLLGCLRGIAGLSGARIVGREGEWGTATAEVAAGADPREEAFARLAQGQARLRELRLDLPTLEEFFQRAVAS
jgi:ABC-2 type transport system ATP-binding protein